MSDSRLVVSALLAYAQAASQEVGNKGYEVGTMQDALSSQVLGRMLGVSITDRRYDPFQLLKCIYYQILTGSASAHLLPCPDISQLDPSEPEVAEFIKFYTLILISQAVWSEANERYVKVIQGLEEQYQECLIDIIENRLFEPQALTKLPEDQPEVSNEKERDDTALQEAELCYKLAKKASDNEAQHDHTRKVIDKPPPIEASIFNESSKGRKQSSTQVHARTSFTFGESESDVESPVTYGRPAEGYSESPPARVSDKIKQLEIERLASDLDEKVEELKQLETQLADSRQSVDVYLRRIAELESQVEENERLRIDVETYRHASEKLRKSENVVDKLRKKLESVSNARSEIQSLQKQVKTLTEENADWESKYTDLFRSRKLQKSTPSSVGSSESESQLLELSTRIVHLELALQAKGAEVVQLKEITVRREERDVDEAAEYESSDDERGQGQKQRMKPQPLSSSLPLPESPSERVQLCEEDLERKQTARQIPMKSRESTPTPRQREVENAPEEQEPVDPGNLLGRTDRVSHVDVMRLQDEVARLQQALAEAEQRYRVEKLLMLRAWAELGHRTAKMGVGANATGGSTGNSDEARALVRPVGLSWASRVRQRMHTVPDTT
ncbi:hypothetical protein QFC24_002364 [Naganishia onofrii]|uniref:Uncharacterized protein n=1 Tax=Naganishia onofrii TaxID=1851511 RepID=A0ACC2XTS5_9TREE|nr:hypothetical protein QFC24_002364 [Naganishia onofrii]